MISYEQQQSGCPSPADALAELQARPSNPASLTGLRRLSLAGQGLAQVRLGSCSAIIGMLISTQSLGLHCRCRPASAVSVTWKTWT